MAGKNREEARKKHIAEAKAGPVLCINCEHCESFAGGAAYKCCASKSLVTGNLLSTDCAAMRLTTGQCGPSGKLFTPRSE